LAQFCIYNDNMTPPLPTRRNSKAPPPGETGQEALYLRSLSDRQVNIQVKLRDGETVRGWIEYFDDGMLRLTREGKPNLFIYKHQIQTITEVSKQTLRRLKIEGNGHAVDGAAS
jgi:host factor-I protein